MRKTRRSGTSLPSAARLMLDFLFSVYNAASQLVGCLLLQTQRSERLALVSLSGAWQWQIAESLLGCACSFSPKASVFHRVHCARLHTRGLLSRFIRRVLLFFQFFAAAREWLEYFFISSQ